MIEPPMGEVYAMAPVSQTLLDDAAVNIEQWLALSLAERFDQQEGAAFISGDGVKKPRGFLTENTAAQTGLADVAWNSLGFAISGAADGFAPNTATTADGFTRVIGILKPAYRANARFVMNRMTEANIARLKDSTGQPLWRMSLRDGLPAQLMGYPVQIMDDMPDIADGAFPVAFGDFQRGYQIVDRMGIRPLRDPYTAKPFVLFYATKRVGGATKRHEAIKLLRTAAS
jgi:HK97 family phage major capsid protein